jgi:Resolvase, N terminal domain
VSSHHSLSLADFIINIAESDFRYTQEDASRFARDLVAQELGLLLLIKRDVRVLTANGDDLTDTSDPSRVMMRQIAGSFAQYEKTRLVTKLRGARERLREANGKCEGRKSTRSYGALRFHPARRTHVANVYEPAGGRYRLAVLWVHRLTTAGTLNNGGFIHPKLHGTVCLSVLEESAERSEHPPRCLERG